jgi:hypothetical protein
VAEVVVGISVLAIRNLYDLTKDTPPSFPHRLN